MFPLGFNYLSQARLVCYIIRKQVVTCKQAQYICLHPQATDLFLFVRLLLFDLEHFTSPTPAKLNNEIHNHNINTNYGKKEKKNNLMDRDYDFLQLII